MHSFSALVAFLATTSTLAAPLQASRRSSPTPSQATILNSCPHNLYLWIATPSGQSPVHTIKPGTSYTEAQRTLSTAGGVSLKLSPDQGIGGHIEQFEYTVDTKMGKVWCDLSEVDGKPFPNDNLLLEPSTRGDNCVVVVGGKEKGAYQWSTDDTKTHACGLGTDLKLTMCAK